MGVEVEAIYENGQLQLLSPVPLENGTKVTVYIDTELDEDELLPPFTTIDVDWKGGLTASEMIIEEREERGI